jgi:hypothetical protein
MNEALLEPPKRKPRGTPVLETLHAGTEVFRIHHVDRDPEQLNWRAPPSRYTGGRFDSMDSSSGCVYVGDTPGTAIAETICRDLPLTGAARLVPWARIAARALSRLVVTDDLSVLSLHGADLTHVSAPLALTKCDADRYETTRTWARALRRWVPDAQGFEYRPRHDEDGLARVLFAEGSIRRVGKPEPLTSARKLRVVRDVLHRHNATFE